MMRMSSMREIHLYSVSILWILLHTTFFSNFIILIYDDNFYYQYTEHIYYIHVQFFIFYSYYSYYIHNTIKGKFCKYKLY